ncbi:MAG: hypothetical protein OWT27_04210, partial [Firmicutes bacterium]|nr:hypothetical protein [Bacillota bacterium]
MKIEVWWTSAPRQPIAPDVAHAWLQRDELERWERFGQCSRRNQFLCARMLVKSYLSTLSGSGDRRFATPPRLTLASDGRPYAAGDGQGVPRYFSITHSGPCVGAA